MEFIEIRFEALKQVSLGKRCVYECVLIKVVYYIKIKLVILQVYNIAFVIHKSLFLERNFLIKCVLA